MTEKLKGRQKIQLKTALRKVSHNLHKNKYGGVYFNPNKGPEIP